MATAKDVMTENPIVLESSMSIQDAVNIFAEKKISSAPVVTSIGEVAGQMTELALVRALVFFQLQPEKYQKLAHCTDLLEQCVFVDPTDNITVVMKGLLSSSSRRVLVRSGGRKILGIISPKDMMRALNKQQDDVAKKVQAEIKKMGDGKITK